MCYYKRTRYSCYHSSFTVRLRPCHVQVEYEVDREGCAPCDVRESHPLHTVSIRSKCMRCRDEADNLKKVKAELGVLRARVEELELARGLAKERLEKRPEKAREEGAGSGGCEAGAVDVKEEKSEGGESRDEGGGCWGMDPRQQVLPDVLLAW